MNLISRKKMKERIRKEVVKEIAIDWAKAKIRSGENVNEAINDMKICLGIELNEKEILVDNFS